MLTIRDVLKVVKLTIPVATAYLPLGMALGVFMVSQGLCWFWAPISAFVIFAGSIEFVVVTFILASYPILAVAWAVFIINFRHIFYGISFPIKRLESPIQKIYGIFALTDETYAIVCIGNGKHLSGQEITLLQILSHLWWVGGALIGSLMGNLLPSHITGFEFALTAMFITLSVDAIHKTQNPKQIIYALISCVVGFAMEKSIPSSFLSAGILCYLILISQDYLKTIKKAGDA